MVLCTSVVGLQVGKVVCFVSWYYFIAFFWISFCLQISCFSFIVFAFVCFSFAFFFVAFKLTIFIISIILYVLFLLSTSTLSVSNLIEINWYKVQKRISFNITTHNSKTITYHKYFIILHDSFCKNFKYIFPEISINKIIVINVMVKIWNFNWFKFHQSWSN